MTSAAPTPSWIPTTIDELLARLERGEWPRIRALYDDARPFGQCVQGRATKVTQCDHIAGISHRIDVLSEATVDGTNDICTYLSKSEPPQLWVWAVPRSDLPEPDSRWSFGVYLVDVGRSAMSVRRNNSVDSDLLLKISRDGSGQFVHTAPRDWGDAYFADLRLTLGFPEHPELAWPAMIGEVSRLVSESKRRAGPSHRSYTMTAETLALALEVAKVTEADLVMQPDWLGDARQRLRAALRHAEGMPADDLRKLVKWARSYWADQEKQDSDLIEIIDSIHMHLALDEMPAGSVDVIGEPEPQAERKITVTSHPHVSIKDLLATSESESLDRLGDWLRENMGEHFAVEGIADTAIRRLREADVLPLTMKLERDRLAAGTDQRLASSLIRIDRAVRGIGETATYRFDTPSADGIAHRVHALAARLAIANASLADNDRTFALIDEELGHPPKPTIAALTELFRKNRRLDVVLGEMFEISKHGQALSADELIAGAKVKLERLTAQAAERSLTTVTPSFVDKLAAGIEFGRFVLHASPQDDIRGDVSLVVHERTERGSERVFAITNNGSTWSTWSADAAAARRSRAYSLALIKIDSITRGRPYDEQDPGGITPEQAEALVGFIGEQKEGFRQLAERTMTATAELAACEALIHRGFDRLREVDPDFVEGLRKSGS